MRDTKRQVVRSYRRRQIAKLIIWVAAIILIFVLAVCITAKVMINSGYRNLRQNATSTVPTMTEIGESTTNADMDEDAEPEWQEGYIRYNGEVYAYNEDILTFLIMGIDKKGEVKTNKNATSGGQSDAIFLLAANPHNRTLNIYAVDRNTMTEINMVGAGPGGMDVTGEAQIAIQHGFGDGKEGSCELMRDAVSRLLFDLPIHGYVSVNYSAIPTINDKVGGVEVPVTEDIAGQVSGWSVGDTVTLKGKEAITYVKWRDTSSFESARMRLYRQKEYLTNFVVAAKSAMKQDMTMPVKLYNDIKSYVVTDMSVDEIAYLGTELMSYSFNADNISTMPGETIMGEEFEEFYPDMDKVKAQIIEIFYEKVDMGE